MNNTAEILDVGMSCLIEKLGVVNTEYFISTLVREKTDYTKWRRQYFGDVSVDDFLSAAVAYDKEHPFRACST